MLCCKRGRIPRCGRPPATPFSCVRSRKNASPSRPTQRRRARSGRTKAGPKRLRNTRSTSMAKDALASEDLAKKFAREKETPYTRWIKNEGLEIIPALYVRNLRTVELKPWARRGGNAVFVNHDASRISNDSYVMEIPPGKKLEPHRQLFEEMVLILEGRGS